MSRTPSRRPAWMLLKRDFVAQVESLMAQKGVSRAELARRMGADSARVTVMLRPDRNITMRQMARIGRALGYVFRVGMDPR